jgi:hypothetical protein
MDLMAEESMLNSIFDALVFLTRRWAIPKNVLLDAAAAARKVIYEYIESPTEER